MTKIKKKNQYEFLCIIPARAGSKGIKGKNMVNLNGKPLIYYTLNIVKKISKVFKIYTVVSSDDQKVLNFSKKMGFINDYFRPKKISKDNTKLADCVKHLADYLKKKGLFFKYTLILQPTSPDRKLKELSKAIKIIKKGQFQSLMSVTPIREHPYETIIYKKKKWKHLIPPPKKIYGRQEFPREFFFIDGSFYIFKTSFFESKNVFYNEKKTFPFILNKTWPIDIDYPDDLIVASSLMKKKKN